jgi:predicted component of type VI protein secretion system
MPRLQVILPDGSQVSHELTEDTVTIGRVSDNTIQIEDASVSSHHAELTLQGADYIFKDIGSTNGSRLNGQEAPPDTEFPLQGGFHLLLGSIPVEYLSETGSEQQPLPHESEPGLTAASTSVAPTDFANASPFSRKGTKRDSAGMAVVAFGVLALLAAGGAIALIMQMEPPVM